MANMNFGVNILPKANNTYTLGNSDYKWNIFANTINGASVLTDVQVSGTSIVNNGIASLPEATTSQYGLVRLFSGGALQRDSTTGAIKLDPASSAEIKAATSGNRALAPYRQHESVFYGLAKAAGDSTQSASSNTVGTYTSGAKTAIQNMLAVAPTANPIFTGSISLGRKANTTIGENSFAVGSNIEASGEYSYAEGEDTQALDWVDHAEGADTIASGGASHAEGYETVASGWSAHAEGGFTIASGDSSHAGGYKTEANGDNQYVFGTYNVPDTAYTFTPWTANTLYKVGDKISIEQTFNGRTNTYYYSCITENEDSSFTQSKWRSCGNQRHYVEIVGNGGYDGGVETLSNARALDWDGNEYLNGDLYINCNNDSTGGTSITEALNKKISITSDTITGNPCTFNSDVEDIPLKSIKLKYEFSQSGSGDPSPTNIRPITGISDFFVAHTKKNMAQIRGFSAENRTFDLESTTSNSYGTTINTTTPADAVIITQSSSSTEYAINSYRNGYISIRTDNLVVGQRYDVSFKVTDIVSNSLNASLSDIMIIFPTGSQATTNSIINDTLIFKNLPYNETGLRQYIEVRICGMSCTISEIMITPANTNDGVYEPYDGERLDVTFPVLGKNLFNAEFSRTNVDYQTGAIGGNTTRITSDFVELAPNTYTFSLKESKQLTVYFYTQPNTGSNYFVLSERISDWKSTPFTFTTTEKRYALFVLRNSDNSEILTTDVSEVMLNTGSSASAYEPYCNTVYGGSLELTTGVLTLTHAEYKTTWGAGTNSTVFTANERRRIVLPFTCIDAVWDAAGACNVASWIWSYETDIIHFYNHQEYSYIFLPVGTDDSTEIQIVGTLATPITVQLTPEQIKTFKKTNIIWANTNSPIEIENHIDLETIKEYADNAGIQDVQINGTSILNNKVANIPIATNTTPGVIIQGPGLTMYANKLWITKASSSHIKNGSEEYCPIVPASQHRAAFYGLAKAAGDTTQAASSNEIGTYTNSAKTAIQSMLGINTMTGATSSVAGTSGLVPAPATTDVDKFLAGDGTYKSGGLPMVILSYGNSTWQDFLDAYNNNVIVYCRASSNSNPASGQQLRMAFMAYIGGRATTPTEVEFQYYRSVNSHSATQMSDQVYIYKLTNKGVWSVTVREAGIKQVLSGTGTTVSYSNNAVTVGLSQPVWEFINEETFTNAEEADYTITTDSNNQAFALTDVLLMFETPQQETEAIKGAYGQVRFYHDSNSYFASESGQWTQAANGSAHGFMVMIEQEPGGLFICRETAQTTTSNSAAWRTRYGAGFSENSTSQGLKMLSAPRTISKIMIMKVTGTGHYKLYGKRQTTT